VHGGRGEAHRASERLQIWYLTNDDPRSSSPPIPVVMRGARANERSERMEGEAIPEDTFCHVFLLLLLRRPPAGASSAAWCSGRPSCRPTDIAGGCLFVPRENRQTMHAWMWGGKTLIDGVGGPERLALAPHCTRGARKKRKKGTLCCQLSPFEVGGGRQLLKLGWKLFVSPSSLEVENGLFVEGFSADVRSYVNCEPSSFVFKQDVFVYAHPRSSSWAS